jgi:deoxyhypusine synthase
MAAASSAANSQAPSNATDAVLKPSDPISETAKEVQGIEFNKYAQRGITVEELVGGMANMGFQATSVGEAVRIINDMVSCSHRADALPAEQPSSTTYRPLCFP